MKLQSVMATALWCLGLACVSLPAGACCTGYEWSTYNGATSTTGNMTSHRFQRHSVVTSDGAIHIIVNTGVQSSYTGSPTLTGTLQLYTSSDNGGSWTNTFTFVGTSTDGTGGAVSTDDVRLTTVGGVEYLQVAYDVEIAGGALSNALMFTALSYDPTSNTWSENSAHYPHTIESSGTTVYQQPAIAEDGNSNLWLTDLELTSVSGSGTGTIVVYERTGYYTWTALPLTITGHPDLVWVKIDHFSIKA